MVGDKVIVWGVLTLYNSKTPEITGSQLYSINDETAGGGSGGGSATGDASSFNAADLGLTNGAAFDKVTYGSSLCRLCSLRCCKRRRIGRK